MSRKWITQGLAILGLLCAFAWTAQAGFVDANDIQNSNADASPSQGESNINDYTSMDDQLNIAPGDGVVRVLRTDQKALINDYVTATIPVQNANVSELRNVLRRTVNLEGGRAEEITDNKTGDSFLQVIAPSYMIPYLREAVEGLDVVWLNEYIDGSVDSYLRMLHRESSVVDSVARLWAGGDGFSEIDTTNNAVRRYDTPYRIKEYHRVTRDYDIPVNQVELEVTVYEVNVSNDLKLGVDYIAWKNGPGRNLLTLAVGGYSAEQRAASLTSIFDPFIDAQAPVFGSTNGKREVLNQGARESYRAFNYLLPSSYVDFLQAKGQARIMTKQKIMVKSSQTGVISTENELLAFVNNDNDLVNVTPYRSPVIIVRDNRYDIDDDGFDEVVPGDGTGQPPSQVTDSLLDSNRRLHYQNAGSVGMRLEMTPYVGLESMELLLDLDIGELNGLAPNGTPIINTRTVNTTVRLFDGQEFVIAGLKNKTDIKQSAKAPWLGDVPVLGYLFGGETDIQRKDRVVITVKPHFYLANQANINHPPSANLQELVYGNNKCKCVKKCMGGCKVGMSLPENRMGYDQWLLEDYVN